MLKEVEERLKKMAGAYDHIVWYGICSQCGVKRYAFVEEIRNAAKEKGYPANINYYRPDQVECRSPRCNKKIKMRRLNNKSATHLNDIRKRETTNSKLATPDG